MRLPKRPNNTHQIMGGPQHSMIPASRQGAGGRPGWMAGAGAPPPGAAGPMGGGGAGGIAAKWWANGGATQAPAAPAGGGGAGGPGAGTGSFWDYLQGLQNQANAKNEQRYDQGLGVIQGGQSQAMGMVNNMLNAIGTPNTAPALANSAKLAEAQRGRARNYAIGRGFGNSSMVPNQERAVYDEQALRDAQIMENARQTQLGQQMQATGMGLGVLGDFTRQHAGFIEARTDAGPDMGMWTSMLSQPGGLQQVEKLFRKRQRAAQPQQQQSWLEQWLANAGRG